ncbi:MAG: hypothetical protein WA961_14520 [Rhodanobacter sp.]
MNDDMTLKELAQRVVNGERWAVGERTCRACGCTDLHACPGGCYWVSLDLCSACAKTQTASGSRLPLSAAETVARDHDFLQVIVLAWDGQQTCVATYGTTAEQSAQAAEGGNRIKRALGWPESMCDAVSAQVQRLRDRIAELERQNLLAYELPDDTLDRLLVGHATDGDQLLVHNALGAIRAPEQMRSRLRITE